MGTATATAHRAAMNRPTPSSRAPSVVRAVSIGLGTLGLAALAFGQAAASAVVRIDPVRAQMLAPWNGDVGARVASNAYLLSMRTAADPRGIEPNDATTAIARDAYLEEPLNPAAVALLAAAAPAREQSDIYGHAARLSRRNALLQSKLLEHQIGRSDLFGALQTLNQVLTVRTNVRDQIMDQLVQFLRWEVAPEAFYDILKGNPDWTNQFLAHAAKDEQALDNLIALRRKLPSENVEPATNLAMVNGLIEANRLGEAYRFYRQLPGKASSQSAGWESDIPPLDWSLASSQGLRAQVEGGSDALTVSVVPGRSGAIARRVLPAARQSTRLTARYTDEIGNASEVVAVQAVCLETGDILSTGRFARGTVSMSIPAAPADCGYLMLQLIARGDRLSEAAEFRVSPLHFGHAP